MQKQQEIRIQYRFYGMYLIVMYRARDLGILLVLFRIHLTKDRMLKVSGPEDVID
jgi:hypothetical protein